MSCLFIALEGFSAATLAEGRSLGRLPRWDALGAGAQLTDLAFPLSDARVAMLVSAMTGTWPDQHGILMAQRWDAAASAIRPVGASDRAQPTVWETLDAHGIECVSVGWPVATNGLTTHSAIVNVGFGVTPTPDYQPDLARLVTPACLVDELADCWFRPDDFDAESITPLVPEWKTVNQAVDNRLGLLNAVLAENVSRHAAFIGLLESQPWQFATLCLSLPAELASLEQASESLGDGLFTGLAERGQPLLNDFLSEILRRVPPDTDLVIAGLPPVRSFEDPGFVLLHGPTFDAEAHLPQANVLDFVPLLWNLCGFRSVATMPGRRLLPAIRAGHPLRAFDVPWQPPVDHQPLAIGALLDACVPLESIMGKWKPEELMHLYLLQLLGRSLMAHGEALRALPVYNTLARLKPRDSKTWLLLSDCQQLLGCLPQALDSAYAAMDSRDSNDPGPLLQAATLEVLYGQPETARALLVKVGPQLANNPSRQLQYASILVLMREWSDAVLLLKDVVKRLPHSSRALRLLARSHLAQQSWQEAFDCAIGSLKQNPGHARSYEILAHAMFGMGMRNQAWQAFESAIEAEPTWPRPRAALVMLSRRMGKPQALVDGYMASYQQVKQQTQEKRTTLKEAARSLIDGNSNG